MKQNRPAFTLAFHYGLFAACMIFLFTNLKMLYLIFIGDGWLGLLAGIINLLIVQAIFMLVFHFAVCNVRFVQKNIKLHWLGFLLSSNAVYHAAIYFLRRNKLAMQSYLYLIPVVLMWIYFFVQQKDMLTMRKDIGFPIVGTVYMIAVFFLPEWIFYFPFGLHICVFVNNIFILLLAFIYLKKNLSWADLFGFRLHIKITGNIVT